VKVCVLIKHSYWENGFKNTNKNKKKQRTLSPTGPVEEGRLLLFLSILF